MHHCLSLSWAGGGWWAECRKNFGDSLFHLWAKCKAWAKDNGLGSSIPMFRTALLSWGDHNDYPTLSSKVKAAPCKVIFNWVCSYAIALVVDKKDTSAQSLMRAGCCWHLSQFCTICEDAGLVFSHAEAQQVVHHGWEYLLLWQALAKDAFDNNLAKYKLRPKLHYMAHMLLEIADTRMNPHRQDRNTIQPQMSFWNLGGWGPGWWTHVHCSLCFLCFSCEHNVVF